ncbi:MAG: peroxiredoxin [Limnochordaceae bacterium]|nr:peroxiredoxin [Limnochordaceae bacterium]
MTVEQGSVLPRICGLTQDESELALDAWRGHWVVLYFYPKDNTPGCTREAQAFNEHRADFEALGARIVGVSADSPASHRRFADKYGLQFPLISDQRKEIIQALGVLNDKGTGARRSTLIIDPEGVIRHVFSRVTVDGHVDEVLAKLRELQRSGN